MMIEGIQEVIGDLKERIKRLGDCL